MKENQANSYNNLEEDSIDIIALLKTLWIGKKLIVKTTILFFVVGCVVALLSPVVYTAQTTFIPQVSEDQMSSSKGGLGSLASLAGINLSQSSSTSDSYLSPLLYSKIANSDEFSLKLIEEELISWNGDKFSIKQYMLSETNSSFNLIGFLIWVFSTINFFNKFKSYKLFLIPLSVFILIYLPFIFWKFSNLGGDFLTYFYFLFTKVVE